MVVRQRSVTSHNGHQVPPLAQARKNKYSGGNNEYDSDNITLQGISMYLSVMQEKVTYIALKNGSGGLT
jgi:hypothetical protein